MSAETYHDLLFHGYQRHTRTVSSGLDDIASMIRDAFGGVSLHPKPQPEPVPSPPTPSPCDCNKGLSFVQQKLREERDNRRHADNQLERTLSALEARLRNVSCRCDAEEIREMLAAKAGAGAVHALAQKLADEVDNRKVEDAALRQLVGDLDRIVFDLGKRVSVIESLMPFPNPPGPQPVPPPNPARDDGYWVYPPRPELLTRYDHSGEGQRGTHRSPDRIRVDSRFPSGRVILDEKPLETAHDIEHITRVRNEIEDAVNFLVNESRPGERVQSKV